MGKIHNDFYKQTHTKLIIKHAQFTNDTTTTLHFVIVHFTTVLHFTYKAQYVTRLLVLLFTLKR